MIKLADEKETISTLSDVKEESKEDLREKRIKELEEELGKRAEEIGKQKEFLEGANVVLNTVYYNEELRKHFQDVYQKSSTGVQGDQEPEGKDKKEPTGTNDVESKRLAYEVGELKMNQREQIVADFESKYGINNLPEEDRKKIRSDISSTFSTFGQTVNSVPIGNLSNTLEKAYTSVRAEKLKEEGKIEGFAQARQNAYGSMPTMSSGDIPENADKALNDEQLKWVKKIGVDPDKASKTYKESAEEK